jgi:hypothetical protein
MYEQNLVNWFASELGHQFPLDYQPIASGSTPPL